MEIPTAQVEEHVLAVVAEVTHRKISNLSRGTLISKLKLSFVEVAQLFEKLETRVGQDLPWDDIACDQLRGWQTLGEFMDWVNAPLPKPPG